MGMGGSKSAPDVPDLNRLIGSQVGGNIGLTGFNNRSTLFGTSSPFGTTSWDAVLNKAGKAKKTTFTDPYTGEKYKSKMYNQNINLAPGEQAIYDANQKGRLGLLNMGNDMMGSMGAADPFDFTKSLEEIGGSIYDPSQTNADVEKRLYDLGSRRLDPRFAREQATQEAALTARGIRPGTAAYNAAQGSFAEGKNDAYNQLALTGRGQAFEEGLRGQGQQFGQALANRGRELGERGQYMGERSQGFQQILQALTGGQANMPQFTGSSPQASPFMDYAGAINTNYDQQFKQWQEQMAQKGNMFGGAMSGLAGIIGSDERIKDNIQQVGKTAEGLPIYEFSIGDGDMQTGVMAQDVEAQNPDAVVENAGGIKGVDYGAINTDGTYTVQKNDNIWKIGERLGVDPQAIIEANPDIQNPDFIVPGQQLVVPGMAAPGPEAIPLAAMPQGGPEAVTAALSGPAGPGTVAPGSMPAAPPVDPRAIAAAPPPASVWEGQFVQPQAVPPAPQSAESYQSQLDQAGEQGMAVPPRQLMDLEAIRQLMSTGGMGGY